MKNFCFSNWEDASDTMAAYNDHFEYQLFSKLIVLSIKHQHVLKNGNFKFCKPNVTSSNGDSLMPKIFNLT